MLVEAQPPSYIPEVARTLLPLECREGAAPHTREVESWRAYEWRKPQGLKKGRPQLCQEQAADLLLDERVARSLECDL